MTSTLPSAFLSYSWDDESHKKWVLELAARLRGDGIETVLDQWHAVPGDQITQFMERAVRDNDVVIVVCTPRYRARADGRLGPVGYEGDVMTGEVLYSGNQRKFVPVLRRGPWEEAAPSWMLGKYYVDLSADPYSEDSYRLLLRTLRGELPVAPPVAAPTRFRRVYLETFDVAHLSPTAVAKRLSGLWLIGKNGPWTGAVENGSYQLQNLQEQDRPLVGRLRYSEDGAEPDLGNGKVAARVRTGPPNDDHSGAGLLFRAGDDDSYYSFLLRAGNEVSLALTENGRLRFLWSAESRAKGRDGFVRLEVEGSENGLICKVDDRVVREEKDPVLRTGVVGWMALSLGTFSFADFAIWQRQA